MGENNAKKNTIKAALDVRDLPVDLFGNRKGRQTRKFVLLLIATWADPDGTEAFPSNQKLVTVSGLTDRGLRKVLLWLEANGFVRIEYKAGRHGTNKYQVLIAEEDREQARKEFAANRGTLIDPERIGSGYTRRYTRNVLVPGIPGTSVRETRNVAALDPERQHADPERIGSPNRPLDRPDRPEEDRPAVIDPSPSKGESPNKKAAKSAALSKPSPVQVAAAAVNHEQESRSKQLVELVKQAVLSTTSSACVYAKHWQAIEGQIAGSDWTADELKRAAAECVEDRDTFALSHAGSFLCEELGARIANIRNRADGYPILSAPD